jgi:hypothetical protein
MQSISAAASEIKAKAKLIRKKNSQDHLKTKSSKFIQIFFYLLDSGFRVEFKFGFNQTGKS